MRVLLIQSYLGGNEPLVYPIGIASLKAAATGHEVRLFDSNLHADPYEALRQELIAFRPEVAGFSLRNIDSTNKRTVVFYYPFLKKLIDTTLAAPIPTPRILVGGSGFSMFAHEIMVDEPRIEFGLQLEGELTFPALLDNLDTPERVKSLHYRKDGALLFTGQPDRQVDMNTPPLPDRGDLPVQRYTEFPGGIGVETKRGCILDCIYCIYGFLNGKKLRMREPARVVDDIQALKEKHGVTYFTFVDSVFNIPKRHAEAICEELIRRDLGVTWSAWLNEKFVDRPFVELMLKAGCTLFIFSPDGFDDATLAGLGKDFKQADILRTYELLVGMEGFEISYNFFKNPPGQSWKNFYHTLAFAVAAKRRLGRRVHFEFNAMRVEPNTKLHEIAIAQGFVREGENLLFPQYFTNRPTAAIETLFNLLMRLRGK